MVVTSRPRHKIRHWLNTEQKHRSIELGRKLIEKEAKRLKVPWRKLIAENALDGVLHEYGLSKLDDLYADLGYGKISPRRVVSAALNPSSRIFVLSQDILDRCLTTSWTG